MVGRILSRPRAERQLLRRTVGFDRRRAAWLDQGYVV